MKIKVPEFFGEDLDKNPTNPNMINNMPMIRYLARIDESKINTKVIVKWSPEESLKNNLTL